jgi:DNA-3-methyladenine glycosylase II
MSHHAATRHLSKTDPVMRRLIRAHGKCGLGDGSRHPPFKTLVQAVANQQLNGKAAATILRRFRALFPGKSFPTPRDVLAIPEDAIRGAGFSRAKVAAIRDIAAKALDGTIPTLRRMTRMGDEEIIERLTLVRGVGRWTVEMLLIFNLGRADVLPVDDFGVCMGYRVAYGKRLKPKPKVLAKFGERWKPYRSVAAWYLWRALESSRD